MKTASVCVAALASACFMAALSVHADPSDVNLVQDSDFSSGETGLLTATSGPWINPGYFPGLTSQHNVSIAANPLAPSSYDAVLAPAANQNAVLFQFMTLKQGAAYNVSFYLATPTGNGGVLTVDLNGNVAGVINVAGNTAFKEYTFQTTAGTASGILDFIWTSGGVPATLDIDDVSVETPSAPDDMGIVTGALMLLPLAALIWKRRRMSLGETAPVS
jgi:hypothetical protein